DVYKRQVSESVAPGDYELSIASGRMIAFDGILIGNPITRSTGLLVRVPAPPQPPTPPVTNPTGTLNFVNSASDDTPRTWAYTHPYEIAAPTSPATTTTATVTIELSAAAPTGGVGVPLRADFSGIASSERAAAAVYDIPAALFVAEGETTGTADITITPGSVENKRFRVAAGAAGNYAVGTDAASVEIVVGLPAPETPTVDDFVVIPSDITVEQGGHTPVTVVNISATDWSSTADTDNDGNAIVARMLNSAGSQMPAGVSVHWNTETPHATPTDFMNARISATGTLRSFAVPIKELKGARGNSSRHLVVAASSAEPGVYPLTNSSRDGYVIPVSYTHL
ncbi:MAG: hypothetical protein MPK62_14640, partial [Alphaproteobacteria bacterium]|nr:hypothetical protein [Alphaproteobacteria bacterium]